MPNTYGPQVVLNVPASFAIGVNTDFSVAFAAGDMAGTMVTGLANFPKGDYTVQYYEVSTKKWMDFTPSQDHDWEFGPSGGFPLTDATSYFRLKFNQAMSGTLVVKMKDVNTQEIITQSECVVTAVVGETTDELNARIALGGVVRLATDVTGTLNISNDVEIIGNGHTLHGNIVFDSSSSTVPYNVTIADLNMREDSLSTSAKGYGLIGQNQSADQPVRPVNLVLRDCQITGYAKKGAYFTNSKTFSMVGCTIGDVATEPVNNPNTFGDYAVDLNLCGVTNCAVRIVDNKFTGTCGAIAYDMVLNGAEIGGGSVRISDPSVQERMFRALGFTAEDAQKRFGFLIDAYRFGAPPHAGMAYGLDRLLMEMLELDSLRDVIAFPKVASSAELLSGAPDGVDEAQLKELGIRLEADAEKK